MRPKVTTAPKTVAKLPSLDCVAKTVAKITKVAVPSNTMSSSCGDHALGPEGIRIDGAMARLTVSATPSDTPIPRKVAKELRLINVPVAEPA